MKIASAIERALSHARADRRGLEAYSDAGTLHREMSQRFVEALADEFRTEYAARADVVVLSRRCKAHRQRFGLNELLFDVNVCATGSVAAVSAKRELTYVTKSLWAVESEFARDSRKALFDFNKLVLSNAEKKLFVGPRLRDVEENEFLAVLGRVSDCCTGSVFVALVPQPAKWESASRGERRVWTRSGGEWRACR